MLFKDLLQRYLTDELSAEEMAELFRLLQQDDNQLLLDEEIGNNWKDGIAVLPLNEELTEQAVKKLRAAMEAGSPVSARVVHRVHFFRRWWAAAAILLLLATGGAIWVATKKNASPGIAEAKKDDIQPGRDGAILTLADGSQVSLDSVTNGVIALQGGVTAKVVNGALVYDGNGKEAVFNTISTPKGRQFHVTLPDRTEVWLNSASSIRYPTAFTGPGRNVELTGEAYFEVTKDKSMPFRVNVNNKAEVEVFGTHFNVNAYNNEETINTTLIEGAVRVSAYSPLAAVTDRPSVILKPGQQAQANNGTTARPGIHLLEKADMEKVLAWKNGLFYFDGATLKEVMRQVERWYDVNVVFETKVLEKGEFIGEMTRGITLNQLLVSLEELGVHTRLEGRTLFIMP